MSGLGSLAWTSRRQGRLTRLEEARVTLVLLGRRLQARISRSGPPPAVLGSPPVLPDSRPVQQALARAKEECSVDLFNHGLRTYFWGALLGGKLDRSFDVEVLAVASILHDIELGRTERRDLESCACFAGAGAARALGLLIAAGMAPERAARVAEAIALHLNPRVSLSSGVEAHLLNAGAALDVVGAGAAKISATDRAGVLLACPRGQFASQIRAAMRKERAAAPRTRAGLLMRLGLGPLIAGAERTVFAQRVPSALPGRE